MTLSGPGTAAPETAGAARVMAAATPARRPTARAARRRAGPADAGGVPARDGVGGRMRDPVIAGPRVVCGTGLGSLLGSCGAVAPRREIRTRAGFLRLALDGGGVHGDPGSRPVLSDRRLWSIHRSGDRAAHCSRVRVLPAPCHSG